jgi:hypothetical protein
MKRLRLVPVPVYYAADIPEAGMLGGIKYKLPVSTVVPLDKLDDVHTPYPPRNEGQMREVCPPCTWGHMYNLGPKPVPFCRLH